MSNQNAKRQDVHDGRLIPASVSEVIGSLRGGFVRIEADAELKKIVERIQETGKVGKLKLELTLTPRGDGNREVHISCKQSSVIPPKLGQGDASVFFAERGGLYRDDPEQFRETQKLMARAGLPDSDP